jgi:ADP-heptose:LPS heptosyltransferase
MEVGSTAWLGEPTVKWLIIRFSAIGDCVMAAHVPSRIRRSEPDAEITWAVDQRCLPIIDAEILCNRIAPIARDLWHQQRWHPKHWYSALVSYGQLRSHRFDVGLDLQGHSKTAICLRIANPKRRLAIKATDEFARLLNPVLPEARQVSHSVERALDCLQAVSGYDGDSSPIMPAFRDERTRMRSLIPSRGRLISIVVDAGHPKKAYSSANWLVVARALVEGGDTVVFLGGKEAQAPHLPGTVDLVGKLSLAEACATVGESAAVLCGDTGPGHVAAALGTPVVSIFGPTNPAVFRPWTDRGIVLHEGESPDLVRPEQILSAANEILERYGRTIPHQPTELSR